MNDYVYICRDGENEELRYSLRSLEANLPDGRVWIVGGKPSWYSGNYIPVKQNYSKNKNALANLLAACNEPKISDDFILMNDDFFITEPVNTIKDYHGGYLIKKVHLYQDLQPTSSYTRSLERTYQYLVKSGISDPLDYDIHVPMKVSKKGLKSILKNNMLWRSSYGNIFNIGGTEIQDVKVYNSGPLMKKSYDYYDQKFEYVSTEDDSFETILKESLLEKFPTPSQYELN